MTQITITAANSSLLYGKLTVIGERRATAGAGTPGGGTDLAIEDSTTPVIAAASTLNFGSNLTVVDDGGGQVTINATGGGGGIPEAPNDGQQYGRQSLGWTVVHDPVTVTDSAEIDFTLAGQDISASIVTGSIDVLKLDAGVQASLALADSAAQPGDLHDPVTVTDSPEIDFTLVGQDITADIVTGSIDVLKLDAGVQASLALADSAAQPGDLHDPVTVTDSAEIDFTLVGQDLTADIITGSIDVLKLDAGVQASLALADSALQDAPIDGNTYGRNNGVWVIVPTGSTLQDAYDADTTGPHITTVPAEGLEVVGGLILTDPLDTIGTSTPAGIRVVDNFTTSASFSAQSMISTGTVNVDSPGFWFWAILLEEKTFVFDDLTGPAVFTLFNALPALTNGTETRLAQVTVLNAGVQGNVTGANNVTVGGSMTVSATNILRAQTAGGTADKEFDMGVQFQPQIVTAVGSTADFGELIGVYCQNPSVPLFEQNLGTSGMDSYFGLYMEDITFGGNVPKRVVFSELNFGLSSHFLYHVGTAPSLINGQLTSQVTLTALSPNSIEIDGGGRLRIEGSYNLEPSSPAALAAGTTDNWDGPAFSFFSQDSRSWVRVTTNGAGSTLSGIAAGQAEPGEVLKLTNVGTGALTILHNNAGSAAGNRVLVPGGGSLVLAANDTAELMYDNTSNRWRVTYWSQ